MSKPERIHTSKLPDTFQEVDGFGTLPETHSFPQRATNTLASSPSSHLAVPRFEPWFNLPIIRPVRRPAWSRPPG